MQSEVTDTLYIVHESNYLNFERLLRMLSTSTFPFGYIPMNMKL